MKNPITEMKLSPGGLSNRFERAEESFYGLEGRSIEISNLKNREEND